MKSEPMLTPREKSTLPEIFSPEEDRTHDAASSRTASPTHDQRAIPAPVYDLKAINVGRRVRLTHILSQHVSVVLLGQLASLQSHSLLVDERLRE